MFEHLKFFFFLNHRWNRFVAQEPNEKEKKSGLCSKPGICVEISQTHTNTFFFRLMKRFGFLVF